MDVDALVLTNSESQEKIDATALLDTGANGPSYFPLDTYNNYIRELEPLPENCNIIVTLGDSKTKVTISKKIFLSLQLITSNNGIKHMHLITSWFCIIPGKIKLLLV